MNVTFSNLFMTNAAENIHGNNGAVYLGDVTFEVNIWKIINITKTFVKL